jgi:hypothetical protein
MVKLNELSAGLYLYTSKMHPDFPFSSGRSVQSCRFPQIVVIGRRALSELQDCFGEPVRLHEPVYTSLDFADSDI